jgi:hypothetical protein
MFCLKFLDGFGQDQTFSVRVLSLIYSSLHNTEFLSIFLYCNIPRTLLFLCPQEIRLRYTTSRKLSLSLSLSIYLTSIMSDSLLDAERRYGDQIEWMKGRVQERATTQASRNRIPYPLRDPGATTTARTSIRYKGRETAQQRYDCSVAHEENLDQEIRSAKAQWDRTMEELEQISQNRDSR